MGTTILIDCDYCGKPFERSTRQFNEAKKFGWKQFCSRECKNTSQITSIDSFCSCCGIGIKVQQCDWLESKSKKFYCSKSCAAVINNSNRIVSDDQKLKTSVTLLKRYNNGIVPENSKCIICGNVISASKHLNQKCCSKECGKIYQFGSLPYTKAEVLSEIHYWYNLLGDTPSSKIVGAKLHHAAKKWFGSWNKAMKAAGYDPNTQWMSKKKLTCKDGHPSDSISEMIVDNQLFNHSIYHERFRIYPIGRFTCDFYLPDSDLQIEYFGLYGEHDEYDEKICIKRKIAQEYDLNLIEILPTHLYPNNILDCIIKV